MTRPSFADYHAAVWDEPLVHGAGRTRPPRQRLSDAEPAMRRAVGDARTWSRQACAAATPPQLPELSEPEVLRHYLHLSQETLGMMGISLFGTCTMKYNPRVNEAVAARAEIARAASRTRTTTRCRACSRSSTAST